MAGNVEERVVEMRLDNQNFESGAKKTISTLEKLEKALNLKNNSKGIDDLQNSVNKFDTNHLSNGLQKVQASFSALEVVGMRVISNLTDSIYNFTTKTLKEFTIEPITQGWNKFGDKTTAVATLLAQGYEIEHVNELMNDLIWFTDETSYNFVDMVSNIGKFTATGQDLDASVTAMEGIALWAALSGQNATVASRAMMQLSQAMTKHALRYDDWKSIQNANMDTKEFREQAVAAAEALGVLKKDANGTYTLLNKAGKQTKFTFSELFTSDALTRTEWFSDKVMMKVFNQYSKAASTLQKYMDEKGIDTAKEAMDALEKEATDLIETTKKQTGEVISMDEAYKRLGYEIDEFSMKAFKAGQQARTWKDVVDAIKDAVSTGWMQTFEHLFGDAETATNFYSDLVERLYNIFAEGGNIRNSILDVAFGKRGKGWLNFQSKVEDAGYSMKDLLKSYNKVVSAMDDTSLPIIKDISELETAFKNGAFSGELFNEVINDMTKSSKGSSVAIQSVTKKLGGNMKELRQVAKNLESGKYGTGKKAYDALAEAGFGGSEGYDMVKWVAGNQRWMPWLSDAEMLKLMQMYHPKWVDDFLKNSGKTVQEIEQIKKELEDVDSLWLDIAEDFGLVTDLQAGEMFRQSLLNIVGVVEKLQGAFRLGFAKLFGSENEDDETFIRVLADGVYNAISAFKEFTENIGFSKDALEGLSNIIAIILGAFKTVGKIAGTIIKVFTKIGFAIGNIIDRFLVKFKDFDYTKVLNIFDDIASKFDGFVDKIVGAFGKLNFDSVQGFIDSIPDFFKDVAQALLPSEETILNIYEIIQNKYKDLQKLFGENFTWDNIKQLIPSLSGVLDEINKIGDALKNKYPKIFQKFEEWKKNSPFGSVFESFGNGVKGILEGLKTLKVDTEGLTGVFKTIGDGIGLVIGTVFGNPEELRTKISNFFATIWTSLQDFTKEWTAGDFFKAIRTSIFTILLAKIGSILTGFRRIQNEFKGIPRAISGFVRSAGKALENFSLKFKADAYFKMAAAVGILAAALIALSFVPEDKLTHVAVTLGLVIAVLGLLVSRMARLNGMFGDKSFKSDNKFAGNKITLFSNLAATLIGFGLVIGSIALSIGIISKLPTKTVLQAAGVIAAIAVLMAGLSFGLSFLDNAKLGNNSTSAIKAAAAMMIMSMVIQSLIIPLAVLSKIASKEGQQLWPALGMIGAMIAGLSALAFGLSFLDNSKLGNSSTSALKAAASMTIMALAIRMLIGPLSSISDIMATEGNKIWQAFGMIAALSGLFAVLVTGMSFLNGGAALACAGAFVLIALALNMLAPLIAAFAAGMTALVTAIPWENLQARLEGSKNGLLKLLGLAGIMLVFGAAVILIGAGVLALGTGLLFAGVGAGALAIALAPLGVAIKGFVEALEDINSISLNNLLKVIGAMALVGISIAGIVLAFSALSKTKIGTKINNLFNNLFKSFKKIGPKVSSVIQGAMPIILEALGTILIMTGLYLVGIIPDITEIIVQAFISLFQSVANSMQAHEGELVESITSVIRTLLKIVGDTIRELFSAESLGDMGGIEKVLLFGISGAAVADGVGKIIGAFKGFEGLGGVFGAGGILSQAGTTISTLWESISLFISSAGGLAVLGPVAAVLAGLGIAAVTSKQQVDQYLDEASQGLGDSVEDTVTKVQNLQNAADDAQNAFDSLSDSGAIEGLTQAQDEVNARNVALNKGYEELAEKLGITTQELKDQISAADGDVTKIQAVRDALIEMHNANKPLDSNVPKESYGPVKPKTDANVPKESYGPVKPKPVEPSIPKESYGPIKQTVEQNIEVTADTTPAETTTSSFFDWFTGSAEGASTDVSTSVGNTVTQMLSTVLPEGAIEGKVASSAEEIKSTLTTALNGSELGQIMDWSAILNGFSDLDITKAFTDLGGKFHSEGAAISPELGAGMAEGMPEGTAQAQTAAQTQVDDVTNTSKGGFGVNSPSTVYAEIGTNLGAGLAEGIKSSTGQATGAASSLVSKVKTAGDGLYNKFYSIGVNLVAGLVEGVKSKLSDAYSAGASVAEQAQKGAEDASQTKSPSRVFMRIGSYFVQGLALGMENNADEAYNSAAYLSNSMIKATSSAMERVAALANDNFDISPVITPVVDMTNINSAISTMNGAFNNSYSNTMTARASVLSSGIRDIQVARNGIVSSGDTENMNSNVINLYIDGIKYNTDDYVDSSIKDFVETMVRKQKMYAGG